MISDLGSDRGSSRGGDDDDSKTAEVGGFPWDCDGKLIPEWVIKKWRRERAGSTTGGCL